VSEKPATLLYYEFFKIHLSSNFQGSFLHLHRSSYDGKKETNSTLPSKLSNADQQLCHLQRETHSPSVRMVFSEESPAENVDMSITCICTYPHSQRTSGKQHSSQ